MPEEEESGKSEKRRAQRHGRSGAEQQTRERITLSAGAGPKKKREARKAANRGSSLPLQVNKTYGRIWYMWLLDVVVKVL